jgi:DNA repair protein RadC
VEKTTTYRIPIYKVSLVRDGSYKSPSKAITSPPDAFSILEGYMQGLDREHFVVLLLDIKNKVIGINTVSIGNLDTAIAHPREVFKPAILSNAASILLAHNHPSGDPEPSREDVALTNRLVEAGKILGIDVIDHLILGDGCYRSLKEAGHM